MRQDIFLVDIIYLFVLVLAGDEMRSVTVETIINLHRVRTCTWGCVCNPRAAPTHQMQSAVCTLSLPSITGCRVHDLMSTIRQGFVDAVNKLLLLIDKSKIQNSTR